MHATNNRDDLGEQQLTMLKLTRGDFSIFVYLHCRVEVPSHCVALPKCATLLFFALPVGRSQPACIKSSIIMIIFVLQPIALPLKLSCAVLCCTQNEVGHMFITRMICSHYSHSRPTATLYVQCHLKIQRNQCPPYQRLQQRC